jgi:hypothetical protein
MKITVNLLLMLSAAATIYGQNPLIIDKFTADPSARVFNDKVYVYPSHDIRKDSGRFANWFCMEDYHVYSSENLTQWTDHGVIFSQKDVPWVDSSTFSMWAPDCIEKNGKYYFYFPAIAKDKSEARGQRIGVAVSDSPAGPFVPELKPMEGVYGIDPNPFIDHDGQAYLYWGGGEKLYMAKLKENMLELATNPRVVMNLPAKFKEGPYLFERNGKYYFTFPYVPETTERLVYAMGDSPMGPFEYEGVIMDESPAGCWTNHHSVIEYRNQWYLFYHHNDLSPNFDKNRSIRADSLFFNPDGTIQKVIPTLRGVGITPATAEVQIDRYSAISGDDINIELVDTLNAHKGWQITLERYGAWVRYNKVDFGSDLPKRVKAKAMGDPKGQFEIRVNSPKGDVLGKVNVKKSEKWRTIGSKLNKYPAGTYDLFVVSSGDNPVSIDWIQFE